MRMLRLWVFVVGVILLSGQRTYAQQICPEHMTPTISSLQECVAHALTTGDIDNMGIANSLLQKLDAAQVAQNHDDFPLAILLLNAFIKEVTAQTGKHIDATHAEHMVTHAEAVIAALGG